MQLLRDAYDAMGRDDGRALVGLLTPKTRWIIAGVVTFPVCTRGPDEIFAFWKKTAEQTGGRLRLTVKDVLANDQRGVVLVDVKGGSETVVTSVRAKSSVFELSHDTVSSATFIYEDRHAYDEFWADEQA